MACGGGRVSAPVVVSTGEPVAWLVQSPIEGTLPWVALSPAEADQARERAHAVTPIPASAPVVLPEAPPVELIEQMAKADHRSTRAAVDWPQLREEVRSLYRDGARAQYAVLRAWVAGGGETR